MGDARFVGDDLLGAEGDGGGFLRGQGQGLVVGVGVQAVGTPKTAARAWMATLAMLLRGCWAVRETPAVWAWVRSIQLWGFLAP